MSLFEATFRIPAAHTLREVRCEWRKGPPSTIEREHEEYDGHRTLVAVYESWTCVEGKCVSGFVKYSPTGWVLLRSGLPMPAWPMGGGWPLPFRV